jgi:hypothetical protein
MKRAFSIAFVLALLVCIAWAQAPAAAPAGQQPAAQGATAQPAQGRGGRTPITPRVLSFQATPATIKPGESFVLSWAVEAGSPTIDNGVGPVYQRGNTRLTPKATTTYTLTMAGDVTQKVTVTVLGTTAVAAAANAPAALVMARVNGKPDFSGIYGFTGMAGGGRGAAAPTPPPASPYASLPAQPTLKPGVDNRATPAPAGGTADCLPLPADTGWGVPYPFQIFQNANYMIVIHEYPGTFRIIPFDKPHRADAVDDPTWMGDSVGHWEGDTLVVETIGYNGRHSIGGIQQPSEKFRTIERFTRINAKDIFYEIIYEDPEKATGQWRSTRTFVGDVRAGVHKILEFVCENNRDYIPFYGPEGPPPPGAGRGGRGQ